jgi:class 3 adenylate cyclase/pimeloyl-ACP methyl ester carboxylesterase
MRAQDFVMASDTSSDSAGERKLIAVLYADMVGYSRLIGVDDAGTLARLKRLRTDLIDPAIAEHRGRVVQTGGDSLLVVFDSIDGAVRCAVKVQQQVPIHDQSPSPDHAIRFRMGIDIGDAIADGTDLHGDGVIVAARLQAECPPGSVCVSRAVRDHVHDRLDLTFEPLGMLSLKNVARPVDAFVLNLASGASRSALTQDIRYCRTDTGVRLAYAMVGQGPAVVRCGRWFTHLEYEWKNGTKFPNAILKDLAMEFQLLRYDARGTGMSDWEADDISLEAWVQDLDTVVNAAGLKRFALLGESQSVAVAIAYTARHPERVSRLILYGGYTLGWRKRPGAGIERHEAMRTLMRLGWGSENPAYRQMFTSQFLPDGTKEQFDALNELQRLSTSPEGAVRYYDATGDVDVTALLPQITVPTLVMHVRGDEDVPFEMGRQIAAGIPGARLVALPGRSHALMSDDPALARYLEEMQLFLGAKL